MKTFVSDRNASKRRRVNFDRSVVRLLRAFNGVDLGDVRYGVGPEQQHVQDREEDGHHAESNRDRDDDGERGEWRAPEGAKGVVKVADGVVDERGAALVAAFVGGDGDRSEARPCLRARILGTHAFVDQLPGLALDVELQFVVEVALGAIGQEERASAQSQVAKVHAVTPVS